MYIKKKKPKKQTNEVFSVNNKYYIYEKFKI